MGRIWATQAMTARAPRDVWRDALGLVDGEVETRAARGRPLAGTVASRALADFKLVRFRSTSHAIGRAAAAGHASGAHLLVSLQLGGEARLVQGSREVAIGAGSGAVGLLDVSRPFELQFPSEVERIFVFVPHLALRARAPWLEHVEPTSLGRNNPVAGIMRAYLERIGDPAHVLDDRTTLLLLDGFLGALAIGSAVQRAGTAERAEDRRALRLGALQAYMRRCLGNSALSPAAVAAAFGISARSVHKLFESSDTTFSAWLLSERLEACATALRHGAPDARIAEMALAAGFNDISHFNRTFKARFDMTPRQWRRGH
jgi:AraC family transcriptional regulator, positive regulator of tynA and feaB